MENMSILDAGADTSKYPLIETATFGNIRRETDQQLALVIMTYAATDMGFDGAPGDLDLVVVGTTMLDTAGEVI